MRSVRVEQEPQPEQEQRSSRTSTSSSFGFSRPIAAPKSSCQHGADARTMTTKVTVTCMYAQRPRPTSTAVSTPVAATAPRYGRHAPGWNARRAIPTVVVGLAIRGGTTRAEAIVVVRRTLRGCIERTEAILVVCCIDGGVSGEH